VFARCKNEPYLKEFVDHYFNEGADFIYLIDDSSDRKYRHILKKLNKNKNIHVFYKKQLNKEKTSKIYKKIKNTTEWLLYVDIDEFVTTKINNKNTIKDELLSTFKDAHCVKIPWVMMACNGRQENPEVLTVENTYRWNHDVKHENNLSTHRKFRCRYDEIEVKCVFKTKYFDDIFEHHPLKPITSDYICVSSIDNNKEDLNPYYFGLRERNIRCAYLICYHYRIMSINRCKEKIQESKYYAKYSIEDLMSTDFSEIIDETMKNKTSNR
jgi:hypothetical protein